MPAHTPRSLVSQLSVPRPPVSQQPHATVNQLLHHGMLVGRHTTGGGGRDAREGRLRDGRGRGVMECWRVNKRGAVQERTSTQYRTAGSFCTMLREGRNSHEFSGETHQKQKPRIDRPIHDNDTDQMDLITHELNV